MAQDQETPVEQDEPPPTHEDSPFIAEDQTWWKDITGSHIVWEVDGVPPWEAMIVIPADGPLANYQLAGLRVQRHGGPHPADFALHRVLFQMLGAITLASGHVELEMKRILLTAIAEPTAGFADVDLGWKDLEDELAKVARSDTELAARLRPVLEWAEGKRIRERRNAAIHSAWCMWEFGHLEGARIAHRSDGQTIIDDGQLGETVGILWEYQNRLQAVVQWPTAILPPLPEDIPQRQVHVKVSTSQTAEA